MIVGPAAVKRCGMLSSHATVFAAVAARNDTVIASRELNPLSEGLLREGHASKGFHIKAKSCDWGPMAGFVCADPRFSKAANLAKQRRAVEDAQHAGAGLVHLQISSQRLVELDALGLIEQEKRGITATRILIHATSRLHGRVDFVAVRAGNHEPIWQLYSLKRLCAGLNDLPATLDATNSDEVFGLSNPGGVMAAGRQPVGPHAAVAGDYDLFCVWPHHRHRHDRPKVAPPRVLNVGNARFKALAEQYAAAVRGDKLEDAHMGNVSFYVTHIIRQLNAGMRNAGYSGGSMVHHSDETGNPFTPGQDYPLLFFIPREEPCAIENVVQLREIYQRCEAAGYAVERNQGFLL